MRASKARAPRQRAKTHASRSYEPEGSRPLVSPQARACGARRASHDGPSFRDPDLRLCQRGDAFAPARWRSATRVLSSLLAIICWPDRPPSHRRTTWETERSFFRRHRLVASRPLGPRLPRCAALRVSKCNRGGGGHARTARARRGSRSNASRAALVVASGAAPRVTLIDSGPNLGAPAYRVQLRRRTLAPADGRGCPTRVTRGREPGVR